MVLWVRSRKTMQAATTALNLITTGTTMPVVALGNCYSSGVVKAGSFAQTLARKVESTQAQQSANPCAAQNEMSGAQLAHQPTAEVKLAGRSTKAPKPEAETQKQNDATHGLQESAPLGSNAEVPAVVSPLPPVVSPPLEGVCSTEQLYEEERDGNAPRPIAARATTNRDSVEKGAADESNSVPLVVQKASADGATIADSATSPGSARGDQSSVLKATEPASLPAVDVPGTHASEPQRATPVQNPDQEGGTAEPVTELADLNSAAVATRSSATEATINPTSGDESAVSSEKQVGRSNVESNPSGVEKTEKAPTEKGTPDS
jgi:hypothetical protein